MTINHSIVRGLKHVVIPLILASLIYILLRKIKPLILIKLLLILDLDTNYYIELYGNSPLKYFFLYNLTDALWAYSMTSFVILATINDTFSIKIIYIISSLILILSQEFLQGIFLAGTFDWSDVVFLIAGFSTSIFILKECNP